MPLIGGGGEAYFLVITQHVIILPLTMYLDNLK